MKITHTENPLTISTGFTPDGFTRRNDEHFRQMQARKQAKREQNLDLLMLLSALESAFIASKVSMPDYLIERIDTSVELLRKEMLEVEK